MWHGPCFTALMKIGFLGALLVGIGIAATGSSEAWACGATPSPRYVVDQQAPSGEGIPLNAPIVVALRADVDAPAGDSLLPNPTLTKLDSDQAVALKFGGGAAGFLRARAKCGSLMTSRSTSARSQKQHPCHTAERTCR
jgi:hypothetical protein